MGCRLRPHRQTETQRSAAFKAGIEQLETPGVAVRDMPTTHENVGRQGRPEIRGQNGAIDALLTTATSRYSS